ncbi:MAG TPA: gliding motility-associated C-terminal domain-containing protein [Chitinophagales bacterium]|nr:gliding motility-associated C-terminal domain-containing protein [Chitinophagales bacterium]
MTRNTSYTVTGSINGCTGTAVSTMVTVKPTKSTSIDSVICFGESVTIGSQTFTTSGNYSVVLQTSENCDSIIHLKLTANNSYTPTVSIVANKNDICNRELVLFKATATNTVVTPTYQWQLNGVNVGANSNRYSNSTLNNGDIIKVIITSSAPCVNPSTLSSNEIVMKVNTIAYTKPHIEYCQKDSQLVNLQINTIPSTPYSIVLSDGTIINGSTMSVNTTSSGNIPITITYGNNCSVRDVLPVVVNSLPNINAIVDTPHTRYQHIVQLDVLSNNAIQSYHWLASNLVNNDTIKNPTSIIKASSLFIVEVKDNKNCKRTDSVMVEMIDECDDDYIFMPSAFSPNNDGVNDCFGILLPPILTDYKLIIFNRWSEKIFETSDKDICWDGTYKGEAVQSDSYVYLLSFTCYNEERLSKKGTVSVLR